MPQKKDSVKTTKSSYVAAVGVILLVVAHLMGADVGQQAQAVEAVQTNGLLASLPKILEVLGGLLSASGILGVGKFARDHDVSSKAADVEPKNSVMEEASNIIAKAGKVSGAIFLLVLVGCCSGRIDSALAEQQKKYDRLVNRSLEMVEQGEMRAQLILGDPRIPKDEQQNEYETELTFWKISRELIESYGSQPNIKRR